MVGYRKPLLLALLLLVVVGLIVGIVLVVPKGDNETKKEGGDKAKEKTEPEKPAEAKPAADTADATETGNETYSAHSVLPGTQQGRGGAVPKPAGAAQGDVATLDLPASPAYTGPVYVEKFLLPVKCNGKFPAAVQGVYNFFYGVKAESTLDGKWLKYFGSDAASVKALVTAHDAKVKEFVDKLQKYGVLDTSKAATADVEETLLLLPCNLGLLLHAVYTLKEASGRWAAARYFGQIARGGPVDDDDDAVAPPAPVAAAAAGPGAGGVAGGVAPSAPGAAAAPAAATATGPQQGGEAHGLEPRDWDASLGLVEKAKALSTGLHELVGLVAKHSPFSVQKTADHFKAALLWAHWFTGGQADAKAPNVEFKEWLGNFEKWLQARVKVLGDGDKDVKVLKDALETLFAKVEAEGAKDNHPAASNVAHGQAASNRPQVSQELLNKAQAAQANVNANSVEARVHRLVETSFTGVNNLAALVAAVVGEDEFGLKKPVPHLHGGQHVQAAAAGQPNQAQQVASGVQVAPAVLPEQHNLPLCPHLLPAFWETLTVFLEVFKKGATPFLSNLGSSDTKQQKQEALVQVVKLVHKLVGLTPKSSSFYKGLEEVDTLYNASDLLLQVLKLLQPFLNTWKYEKLGLALPVVDQKPSSVQRANAVVLDTGDANTVAGAKAADGPGAAPQNHANGVAHAAA